MNPLPSIRQSLARALAAAFATLALAGCAGTAPAEGQASTGRGGVEVFGTIDAGVSGVRNQSGR